MSTITTSARPRMGFAALQHRDFRAYLTGATLSMMADNIEHVISYWVLWESFHSPLLAGFAVVSHWMPFIIFGVYVGALSDKYDCRRLIQISQVFFMLASIIWGVLFFTGQLQMWHALVILTIHGLAACLWGPPEQLMLHDIVGPEQLASAVRLNATGKMLGILLGPAVGGLILLAAGPALGIMINALIYLPLSISLVWIKSTGHRHHTVAARKLSFGDAWRTVVESGSNRAIFTMIAVAGMAAFLIGSFTPQMPEFARDLDGANASHGYTYLLLASGLGAVLGGLAMEVTGAIKVNVNTALAGAALWGACVAGFALTSSFNAALVLLFIAGAGQLAFSSIAQTIVQVQAPPDKRGRLVGAFGMAQQGLKSGAGVSVGVLGSAIGIHPALAISALLTIVSAAVMYVYANAAGPAPQPAYAEATDFVDESTPNCC
ncbi:MAG TPA: MFS transporter [Chloroflexota bacterium]|nr:MFS transporter [Chloroflexota bacterium]